MFDSSIFLVKKEVIFATITNNRINTNVPLFTLCHIHSFSSHSHLLRCSCCMKTHREQRDKFFLPHQLFPHPMPLVAIHQKSTAREESAHHLPYPPINICAAYNHVSCT